MLKRSKKRKKRKPRPVIKITSGHIEITSMIGVYGILLLELFWFLLDIIGVLSK